jgi:hypothetical protein
MTIVDGAWRTLARAAVERRYAPNPTALAELADTSG